MEWGEELLESHLSLSEADVRFREFARRDPELSRRATFRALDEDYREADLQLQPWPVFVGRAKLAALRDAAVGLSRLVRGIAERIFANDPARIAEAYGLGPIEAALILAPPLGLDGTISRADFVDSAGGFKCLEFNYAANLGGWETTLAVDLHQRIPAIVRYLRTAGLGFSFTDTLAVLFAHILEEVERRGLDREGSSNVAFIVERPIASWAAPLLDRELQLALARRGSRARGRIFVCPYGELRESAAGLWRAEHRIHAVVEFQTLGVVNPAAMRRAKKDQTVLLNGPIARILGDKRNLALLSERQDSGPFTAEERGLLERHLPWTRAVSPRPVRYRGEEVFLPDLLALRRADLVLKAARSSGSRDVALGRETPEGDWADLVRSALGGGRPWIVQEHVASRPFLFQDGEQGCAPHAAVWGPFVFGDKYAGVFLRVKPLGLDGPISLDRGGSTGLVLEV